VTFELSAEAFDSVGPSPAAESRLDLLNGSKYLVNPGSVGQPRDGDPRAAYAIVDVEKRRVELIRLKYPVEEAQAKVIKAGLPEVLAQRLGVGR
jgi:diadenosine tetraphosphatase ApaH/serine/threonine PP2A family protein phosphatase